MIAPILIVDDVMEDALLLKTGLTRVGIQNPITILTQGQTAIEYLQGHSVQADRENFPVPTAVFLDLKMPDVDGYGVLRVLRGEANLKRILVVVHSGIASTQDVSALYAAGANTFLTKSSSLAELENLVLGYASYFTFSPKPVTLPPA